LFSYYLREVVIPTLLSKILLYLPVDIAKLGEPRKFLCVSFLILSYPLPFILSGLHASILTLTDLGFKSMILIKRRGKENDNGSKYFEKYGNVRAIYSTDPCIHRYISLWYIRFFFYKRLIEVSFFI